MASNYTEHYQLPLWEPEDAFLREEFNEANEKIDIALRNTFRPENLPWVVGSYTGTGAAQEIKLGFKPSALMIYSPAYQMNDGRYNYPLWLDWGEMGYMTLYYTITSASLSPLVGNSLRTENGFGLDMTSGFHNHLNYAGEIYYYLALK